MLLGTAWIGIERLGAWLDTHPVSTALLGLGILCLIALIALLLVRRILLSVLTALIKRSSTAWDDILLQEHLFHRVIWAVPVVIVHRGLGFVPNLPPELVSFLQRLAVAALVVIAVRTLSALLAGTNRIYGRYPMSRHRPIKGYIQVVLIIVHVVGLVFMVALLIDRSPWYFLSGLGAMMAVILLVFRDTLLSLVAGIQSDIFDHLLAVAPSFGLRVYQQPSGADIRHALSPGSEAAESCP